MHKGGDDLVSVIGPSTTTTSVVAVVGVDNFLGDLDLEPDLLLLAPLEDRAGVEDTERGLLVVTATAGAASSFSCSV